MKVLPERIEKESNERDFDAISYTVEVQLTWHEQRRLLKEYRATDAGRYDTIILPFYGLSDIEGAADLSTVTLSYWTELEPDWCSMRREISDLNNMFLDDLSVLREIVSTPIGR